MASLTLVVASACAVLTWFVLYKFLYTQSLSPGLPGEGIFKYVVWKDPVTALSRKTCARHKAAESKWSSKVRKKRILRITMIMMLLLDRMRFLSSWVCPCTH